MRKMLHKTIMAVLLLGSLPAQAATTAELELRAARNKAEVEGDLKAAIQQYGAIVAKYKTDRAVAATALVHMAECYQKMGDAESRKIYEQVVKDYADQKEAVALARTRLGRESATSHGPAFRQVWKMPNMATIQGTASHDGRYLPYVGWGPQNGDLFLHDFVTGEDRRLTKTATDGMPRPKVEQFAEEFSVSPDNKQVAYSWFREDLNQRFELRLVDLKVEGIPQPRLLFENPDVEWISPDDWSPDGKWIAVRVQRTDKTVQIGLLSVSDSSLRVLKTVDWRGAGIIFFSPDGKYLGYDLPQSDTSPQRDVFALAVDGSREIPAVVHRSHDIMMGWAPDGQRLLFASDRTGSMDLWSLPFANGNVGEPELIKADIGRAEPVALTRSGALYVAIPNGSRLPTTIQIAAIDFNTGKLTSALTDIAPEYIETTQTVQWSVDGKFLAYTALRGRTREASTFLVIRSADTNQLVRELRVKLNRVYPGLGWAQDGHSLLIQGQDFKGRWGVYRIDAQSGDLTLLISDQSREILYPTWSRDGESLYFSRRIFRTGKEFVLMRRDLATGKETELLRRPFIAPDQISPDGRHMAVSTVDVPSNSRIKLLIPTAGGEPREVMRVPAGVGPDDLWNYGKGIALAGTQWAPDGRSFFTIKRLNDEKHRTEIWRVPLEGGVPTKTDLRLDELGNGFFQLHPDGKRIAFSVAEKELPKGKEVWALENFLPPTTGAKR